MTASDRRKFREIIIRLLAPFGRAVDAVGLDGWWLALQDLSIAQVDDAAVSLLRESRYPPTPADIRSAANVTIASQASAAWAMVIDAIRKYGSTYAPHFADTRAAEAARRMGGWPHLCSLSADELHSFRAKDFKDIYATLHAAPPDNGPMPGGMRVAMIADAQGHMPAKIETKTRRSLPGGASNLRGILDVAGGGR